MENVPKKPIENVEFILSENYSVFVGHDGLKDNICFLGGCGVGKTRNGIKANLCQLNSSCVIADPGGVLTAEMGHLFEEAGYQIKVHNTIDLNKSMRYNPLHYVKSDKDIFRVVDAFLDSNSKSYDAAEALFKNVERLCLSAIVSFVVDFGSPSEKNFDTVIEVVKSIYLLDSSTSISSLDVLFKIVAEGVYYAKKCKQDFNPETGEMEWLPGWIKSPHRAPKPNALCVRQFKKFKNVCDAKTERAVLKSLYDRFSALDNTEFKDATAEDSLDLETLSEKKTVLFVIYAPNSKSPSFLSKILIEQAYEVLFDKAYRNNCEKDTAGLEDKVPVVFYLDEFAMQFPISDFLQILEMGPSCGVCTVFTSQSLSQIRELYSNEATLNDVFERCGYLVWMPAHFSVELDSLSGTLLASACIVQPSEENKGIKLFEFLKPKGSTVGSVKGYSIKTITELPPLPQSDCYVLRWQHNGFFGFPDRKYDLDNHPNAEFLSKYHWGDKKDENHFDIESLITQGSSYKMRLQKKLEGLKNQREKLDARIEEVENELKSLN